MKKQFLVLLLLMLMVAFTAAGLDAKTFISETAKKPLFLWGGLQLGAYGEIAAMECSLSMQFSRKGYGSVYWLGGSEPFGNDSVNEYSFMVGRCFRTRSTFTGMAAGLGVASGWIGSSRKLQGVGVPLKLEGSLIIGSFVAFSIQFHAFIWERSYTGISFGFLFGKMR